MGDIQPDTHSGEQKETYSQAHIQVDRRIDIHKQSDKHSGEQKNRHIYTVRETFRRTEGRLTIRHTFRRTEGHTYIYTVRETFRRSEGQTYIYSQRNIQADRWETYSQTHIQADRRTYIHIQSEKHSGGLSSMSSLR